MKYLAFCCIAFFLLPFEIHTQPSFSQQIDSLFLGITDKTPGAAVIVVQNEEVVFEKNYGLANLEHHIPITKQTVFDIASISKQFCGMAIAMLIENGKLHYEDDVRKYIPELPYFGSTITIGHLLHHTSGIRDWTNSLALAGWSFDDVISMEQILNMAYHQHSLNFEPGSEYLYSNTGYNILAEVVHRISGQTFRAWTDENIFKPLGMNQTHFQDDHSEIVPYQASSYYRGQDGVFHRSVNSLTALGSSSLFTTTSDLAKWVTNLDNAKIGGHKVITRMMQTQPLTSGQPNTYAYGLVMGNYKGLQRVSHGGSWAGFRTSLHHYPEQHFSVIVLLNAPMMSPNQVAQQITNLYLKNHFHAEETTKEVKSSEPTIVDVPSSMLNEYLGTYRLGAGWYVTITQEGNQLITTATNESSFPMKATSQSDFLVPAYSNRYIRFKRDEDGKVTHFEYSGMNCPKMQNGVSVITPDMEGLYRSDELSTMYKVQIKDDKLAAYHPHNGEILLTPMWEGEFAGERFFMASVQFDRDKDGVITAMRITSGRSRNQIFYKTNSVAQFSR